MDPFHLLWTAFGIMLMVVVLTPFFKIFNLALRGCVRSFVKTIQLITGN